MNNSSPRTPRKFRASLLLLLGVTVSSHAEPLETVREGSKSIPTTERTRANFTFRNGESHTRTVERLDNYAVAEGDMILGNAEDFFAHSGKRKINGLSNSAYGRTWPNGIIPFFINANLSTSVVDKIRTAVDHWNSIGAVTLVERTESNSELYPDYIDFVDANRCASWIGYQATGPQKIYTGDKCSFGSIIHEIGHALGLLHEHTRPDRDNFVKIHWDRIQTDMELNFEIIDGGIALGDYDYGSIMHYGPNFFSNDGRPTLEPIQATTATIGQRITTSAGDRQSIADLYKSNLSLVTSAATESVNAGGTVEVTLYVTNRSPTGANTLQVTMPVATDSTLLSYTATNWSCDQNGTGSDVVCESPVLAAGADTSLGINVTATSTAGQLLLDATLTSRTLDSDTGDNQDSTVVTVIAPSGDTPVIAAFLPDPTPAPEIASKNVVQQSGGSAGGGGALDWLSFGFLLVLFPFIRFRKTRSLTDCNIHT